MEKRISSILTQVIATPVIEGYSKVHVIIYKDGDVENSNYNISYDSLSAAQQKKLKEYAEFIISLKPPATVVAKQE